MRRFFVRPEDVNAHELRLREDEAAHLTRVLRLGPGGAIVAFDGLGYDYEATIQRATEAEVVCRIVRRRHTQPAQAVSIVLGQGLPKTDAFEWIIQKATELGVAKIVPLLTERVVPQLAAPAIAKKVARWEKLAREACKQCGRSTIPRFLPPTRLESFYPMFQEADLKLVCWEGAGTRGLRPVLAASGTVASVAVVIGPEGGLTAAEVERGESYGFRVAGLGERILRTETASVAIITLLQYHFGDLG